MLEELDKSEVLRYLGYRQNGLNERMEALISRCAEETLRVCEGKYVYKRFPAAFTGRGVELPGTGICLTGKDIRKHLENCREWMMKSKTDSLKWSDWVH